MTRYGVKTKSGKVIWILADAVELRDGVLLFLRNEGTGGDDAAEKPAAVAVAGFNLDVVDHFGRPDAFAADPSAATGAGQSGAPPA